MINYSLMINELKKNYGINKNEIKYLFLKNNFKININGSELIDMIDDEITSRFLYLKSLRYHYNEVLNDFTDKEIVSGYTKSGTKILKIIRKRLLKINEDFNIFKYIYENHINPFNLKKMKLVITTKFSDFLRATNAKTYKSCLSIGNIHMDLVPIMKQMNNCMLAYIVNKNDPKNIIGRTFIIWNNKINYVEICRPYGNFPKLIFLLLIKYILKTYFNDMSYFIYDNFSLQDEYKNQELIVSSIWRIRNIINTYKMVNQSIFSNLHKRMKEKWKYGYVIFKNEDKKVINKITYNMSKTYRQLNSQFKKRRVS